MQDTSGVDAHMVPVVMCRSRARYPIVPAAVARGGAHPATANGTARGLMGATPQAEGLVRARGPACFHTLAPAPWGRSQSNDP